MYRAHVPDPTPPTKPPAPPDPLVRQHETDPTWWRIHVGTAAFALVLFAFPTTWVEWACLPLLIVSLIRLGTTWRAYPPLLRDPLAWLIFAWVALAWLSLLWSSDVRQGVEEAGASRFLGLLAFGLVPVMRSRRILVGALAVGFLIGNASQLSHALDVITWNRLPGRNSGWWDPVVGGSLLCAALGLHLAGALTGTGRARIFGAIGCLITGAALAATGTRGAWIGAAGLIGAAIALTILMRRPLSRALRDGAILAGACALLAGGAWLLAGDTIGQRVRDGISEVERAIDEGDYASDTGARILMWEVAVEATRAHPIHGLGAGAYSHFAENNSEHPQAARLTHDHAHGAYVHAAATTGILGLALGLVAWIGAIWFGIRGRRGYALGPALGLIGLGAAGVFDTVQVNAQTAAVGSALLVLCLPSCAHAANTDEEAP